MLQQFSSMTAAFQRRSAGSAGRHTYFSLATDYYHCQFTTFPSAAAFRDEEARARFISRAGAALMSAHAIGFSATHSNNADAFLVITAFGAAGLARRAIIDREKRRFSLAGHRHGLSPADIVLYRHRHASHKGRLA